MPESRPANNGSCSICHASLEGSTVSTEFAEAGEWLSVEFWGDEGTLCRKCLESRGMLSMMYLHEGNR